MPTPARSARRSCARPTHARLVASAAAGPAMPVAPRRRPRRALALAIAATLALLPGLSACKRGADPEATPAAGAAETAQDPAAARIEADVRALADDRMQGRET